jgi:hypothetical protein
MRRLSGTPEVTDAQIAWAYGQFLVRIPVAKLRQIDALRERGIRTCVLSNNNPASMKYIRRMFTADGKTMDDYFDAVFLSYELHELKPSEAIFRKMIAAGGIATGRGMLAAFALGAEGIQMGTRFALSEESSASDAFKKLCIGLQEGDTMLALKKLSPTRLIRNDFFRAVEEAENRGATAEELQQLLGRGRSKRGIFEGDLTDGELEIGQAASLIRELPTAGQIVRETVAEYEAGLQELVKQATNCKEEI